MTIQEHLIDLLTADAAIAAVVGSRVHYLRAPQGYDGAYLVVSQGTSGDDEDIELNEQSGNKYQFSESFDVECVSDSLSEALSLGRLINTFHGYRGAMGAGSCQGIFVRDKSDDYQPRGIPEDEERDFTALDLEIIGYKES